MDDKILQSRQVKQYVQIHDDKGEALQVAIVPDGYFRLSLPQGDAHYLLRLEEVRNMTLIAELILRASLMRTESRASHFREDYPVRNDTDWMKWIVVGKKGGKINLRTEPVPLEKYRFKPSRFYMDHFKAPK